MLEKYFRKNKFIHNQILPHEIGCIRIMPILVLSKNTMLKSKIEEFIQKEYNEYFLIIKENYIEKIKIKHISKIKNYNINTIIAKRNRIVLIKSTTNQTNLFKYKKENLDYTLIEICTDLIQDYHKKHSINNKYALN